MGVRDGDTGLFQKWPIAPKMTAVEEDTRPTHQYYAILTNLLSLSVATELCLLLDIITDRSTFNDIFGAL